jgi:hypothetical protein
MSTFDRFFVTIKAIEKSSFMKLQEYDFDLFQPTSKFSEQHKGFIVDGLLSLKQIGRLVSDGYEVIVKKYAPKVGLPKSEIMSFNEWMHENQQDDEEEGNRTSKAEKEEIGR